MKIGLNWSWREYTTPFIHLSFPTQDEPERCIIWIGFICFLMEIDFLRKE